MTSVTIRDVARKANVGIGTVSRVINNSTAVSQETREKVLDAIKDLGYMPHPLARRLSLGRTLTIGVVLPFLTLPSYVERLRGVQQMLEDSEYDLSLHSRENPAKLVRLINELSLNKSVDGAIVFSLIPSKMQIEQFKRARIPLILVDACHPDVSRVYIDDEKGGYLATSHLIELGHRKIAFLSDYLDNPFKFTAMRKRYLGYRRALKEAGLPFRPDYHQEGTLGARDSFEKAKILLSLADRPSAVFAASDTHAVGVIKAAHELGLKVPENLSVVGYDDIRDAEYLDITTIHQPLFESGVESVNILLASLIEPPETPTSDVKLPIELIIRGTTAPPI
ncbi:MAG: LacI family DNA-binding transcriptional regulator [Anaerolineales bacterium]|jgi:DNA-binding LacI/PurR family transcriptional regulator